MTEITLRGNPYTVAGALPDVGDRAPDFTLVAGKMQDRHLADFAGKRKILNIFPSMDTGTCAMSVRKFNDYAEEHAGVTMLQISADLPFAQARFCGNEGLENVVSLSMLRDKQFARDYGVLIADGPMAGLCARAAVVLDENDAVLHSELVSEIADEPDYAAALNAAGA